VLNYFGLSARLLAKKPVIKLVLFGPFIEFNTLVRENLIKPISFVGTLNLTEHKEFKLFGTFNAPFKEQ